MAKHDLSSTSWNDLSVGFLNSEGISFEWTSKRHLKLFKDIDGKRCSITWSFRDRRGVNVEPDEIDLLLRKLSQVRLIESPSAYREYNGKSLQKTQSQPAVSPA